MRIVLVFIAVALALPAFAQEKARSLEVAMVEARTHPDSRWYGENAHHFRLAGLKQTGLDGETLTWTLHVKRKLGPWKTAKAWLIEKQKISSATPRDVAFALLYRSLAKQKFQPGQHVAALVATLPDGKEIYRTEIAFNLPATGPHAYRPKDFVK